MRKHTLFGIIAFAAIAFFPVSLYAAPLKRQFGLGGRVTTGPAELSAAITCTASYGPFLMLPFNIATTGPYFIRATTKGLPRPSGYLLGMYKITPDMNTCFNPETGAPIPAFEVKPYGVSR